MSFEDIQQAVCDWLADATGIPQDSVRLAGSGGPMPGKPRAIVEVTEPARASGGRREMDVDADGNEVVRSHLRAVFQVDVYAPGPEHSEFAAGPQLHPVDYLLSAAEAVELTEFREAIKARGATVVSVGDPQDLTAFVSTKHESRARSELVAAYQRTSPASAGAGVIERIIGTIDVDGVSVTVDEAEP